jgi:hypothetical protein
MRQPRHRLRFALQPHPPLFEVAAIARFEIYQLERHRSIKLRIVGRIDDAMAPAPTRDCTR